MNVILCVDENMGMLFNKRRQSRDSKVLEDIFGMTESLWIHPFSEKMFQRILFLEKEDGVFYVQSIFDEQGNCLSDRIPC